MAVPATALFNAGIGALTGYLGAKGNNKASKRAIRYLDPGAINQYRAGLFPELEEFRGGGLNDLLAALTNQTNRSYGSSVQALQSILARGGMLNSGLAGGGHGALNLARGGQLNQNRVQAIQTLMQLLFGGTDRAIQGQGVRAGLKASQQSPLTAALAGAAGGLMGSFGMGGGGFGGGGGGFNPSGVFMPAGGNTFLA